MKFSLNLQGSRKVARKPRKSHREINTHMSVMVIAAKGPFWETALKTLEFRGDVLVVSVFTAILVLF